MWILAEFIYFRANRIFLDAHSFTLIGNLDGFWSSVPMYLQWMDALWLLPTIIAIFAYFLFKNYRTNNSSFILSIIISFMMNTSGCLGVYYQWKNVSSLPLPEKSINPLNDAFCFTNGIYIKNMSVIHAFIYNLKNLCLIPFEKKSYTMSDEDFKQAMLFVNQSNKKVTPSNHLILILVESLETWAIRPDITPNLYRFIQNHNVIWSQKVISQTRGGTSSDGQLIFNTGLLPIQKGAVCKRYHQNQYPALSSIFSTSVLIQPGDLEVWNQKYMSDAYKIDTNYLSPQNLDHYTFELLDDIYRKYPFIMLATMATHSPFESCANYTYIELPSDMPRKMANYLRCLHYSDSCWGDFLLKIDTDSILKNTIICFQGDHIIFDSNMRNEFEQYCLEKNLDYDVQNNNTAFIAYAPNLQEKTIISEKTYQMDAYPTILQLINCEEYYWKGFGVNILDSTARRNRLISEQEAFFLSDKIIRANWFEILEQ
jgi:phosphoglycerol transferase MdoB-like AlkP superfamily enzyme